MTAGEINKVLDKLDKQLSELNRALIDAGRGHETHYDTVHKTDPLSLKCAAYSDLRSELRREIDRRYGPGAPHRLPAGRMFGPIKNRW